MKIFFDTTVLIDIDKHRGVAAELCKEIDREGHTKLISVISISEMLVGPFLQEDYLEKELRAKEILASFTALELDEKTAELCAKLMVYEITRERDYKYQDTAIAASFLSNGADFLITDNIKDFDFPNLGGKVYTPKEFLRAWKKKKLRFVG